MSLNEMNMRLPSLLSMPKVVRDLLWTVTSPHILSGDRFPVLPAKFGVEALKLDVVIDWLIVLVQDPTPILTFLQDTMSTGRSLALGVYFSKLLEFWLRYCPHVKMEKIEIGKQIVSSTNRTVGQLKFLFRCIFQNGSECLEEPQNFHVESSIKFFLLNSTANHREDENCGKDEEQKSYISLKHYVGPHLGENLAWRVQEVDRKLAMRRGDSVHAWLEENYSDSVHSYIVLRGYLFEPLSSLISTSETSVGHDWSLHRNHVTRTQNVNRLTTILNPSIATDHLRGWWTADVETDLPAKVRANSAEIGQSRFVILPKLHWLCPVIAVENKYSGKVVLSGENKLNLEDVEALILDELMAFVRKHFQKDEIEKLSAVAMPLLVAEIVRFPNFVDKEEFGSWYELSRGFILDSTSWDPSPLSQEPVRYKRTLHPNAATGHGEREYEVRRMDCAEEGFIKPDVDNTTVEEKRHQFTDPATIGPRELCHELVYVLSAKKALYSHAELKRSTRDLFQKRLVSCNSASIYTGDGTAFLRACFESLIFVANDSDGAKHSRRAGYLLVDVFYVVSQEIGSNKLGNSLQECSEWTTMLAKVACDPERWEFLSLLLRAIDLTLNPDDVVSWGGSETSSKLGFLDELLAARTSRWNAIVVEVIRVFRVGGLMPGYQRLKATKDAQKIKTIFREFVEQQDWQNAERLATVVQDQDMVQTLFKHLSLLNMTKALKRLQQIAGSFLKNVDVTLTEQSADHLAVDEIPLRHPIDHAKNRLLYRSCIDVEWVYVTSAEGIEEVVRRLKEQESSIVHAEKSYDEQSVARNLLIALDCEWRPQFLAKAQPNQSAALDNRLNEDEEGLSLYQLAIGTIVYVVDVQVLGVAAAAPLSFIWRPSSRLMLIGFCVSSDIPRIQNSFPDLKALFISEDCKVNRRSNALVLELRHLALSRHIPAKHWGLSRLHRVCVGEQLDKEQQCSDWGMRPLSTCQIKYAATDAFAVQRLSWHLLADITFVKESCALGDGVRDFLNCYDVSRNFSRSWTITTKLQPLGKQHVALALKAHGIKARFLKLDQNGHKGLVVKSIAVLVRRAKVVNALRPIMYVVVVLPLSHSIDMQALAALLNVDTKDISLADPETLVRVFGYSRGCLGPMGLREQQATQIIVDASLQEGDDLLCGAGVVDEVYAIDPAALIRAVNAVVACIAF